MILAFSIWDIIQVPFGYLLDWLYQLTSSYGVALILFAILVKIILFPATAKSKKSSMKMSRLTPRLQAIQKKYENDQQKQSQAIQELYKEEGVSMGGGCLWSLLPLLILLPLYTVVRQPIQYMLHETKEVADAVVKGLALGTTHAFPQLDAAAAIFKDPAKYAAVLEAAGASARTMKGLNFNFLGSIDLGAIPQFNIFASSWKWDWAHIGAFLIPILSAGSQVLSMLVSQKMNNSVITNEKGVQDKEAAKNSQANQTGKMMMYMMPLMSLWIGFTLPAAMSLYWFIQGVVSMAMDVYLTKKYRKIYDAEDAIRLQKFMEQEAIEAEKERVRAARRANSPEGITQNTRKQKEEEAAKAAAAKEYATKKGLAVDEEEEKTTLSGVADRPYCKGRAYDPTRYSNQEE